MTETARRSIQPDIFRFINGPTYKRSASKMCIRDRTMASTEASGEDKETEKETQRETEKETEETQKGADSSSALSVRSKIATEKQGKTSIEYAVLSNLRDPKMEDTVNSLIKEKALQVLTDYQIDPAADTLSVKCTVVSLDKNKAVLTYEAVSYTHLPIWMELTIR